MRKENSLILILVLIVLGGYTTKMQAQQEAQYTQYMYNTLSINPAYAGARDILSFVGLYRTQWVGLEGAPKSFTASVHAPLGEEVGLGVNITNDEIFIMSETYIDIDFSYTLKFSNHGKLALGLKAGGHFLDVDFQKAIVGPYQNGDTAILNVDKKFSPQVGLGAYYRTDRFYLGLSVPNLLETKHYDFSDSSNNSVSSTSAKERMNFYLMSGYVFAMSDKLKFKPSALIKMVEGAPLQVDLSANFLIRDKFTIGAAYRWSAALSAMAGFQVSDRMMLGFAYDWETTDLQQYNNGSFEFFLRYELFKENNRMISPRFF